MYRVANLSPEEREILFRNTAQQSGRNEAVIEKDFWVCLTLDYLFHQSPWQDKFAFKGGTSLSKVYGLIERFSEDIDLILDWRVLGYAADEPWMERSNRKQQQFIKDAEARSLVFLREEFLPVFKRDMSSILGTEADVFLEEDDAGIVSFAYPGNLHDDALQRAIRLEIGALAAWTPTQFASVRPDAANDLWRVSLL